MAIDYKVRDSCRKIDFSHRKIKLFHWFKVNIEEVRGSGKDGRVLKDDIVKYLETNSNVTAKQPECKYYSIWF